MKKVTTLLLLFITILGYSQSPVPKKESGSKFSINCANVYFQVDSAKGARIWSFKCDDKELMYVGGNDPGSTFWPGPQSVWSWPPPANLDNKPYSSKIENNKITFTGATDNKTNLRFYKTMYGNEKDTSIIIDYVMKNVLSSVQKWAPWEITRVIGTGLTVFPIGEGSIIYRSGDEDETRTEELGGYGWYDQDNNEKTPSDNKFFCDGRGWIAHIVGGEMLFLKKFDDITAAEAAPGEAEIEVYTSQNDTYSEIENLGAYSTIQGKDSVTWKVKWFARKLPASVDVSVGSKSLTDYIEGVINRSSDPSGSDALNISSLVKLYPSPADSYITVESNLDSYDSAVLVFYNTKGQVIMSQTISQPSQKVSVSGVVSGTYIYELKRNSKVVGRGNISVK